METHKYKENPLSPSNCIACGLNEYSWRHSKAPEKQINPLEIAIRAGEKLEALEAPTDESWDEKRDIYKMGFEVGKSEAFSLVRKMVHNSEDLRDPKTQIYKIINAHDFLSRLSTLEGM